MVASPLVETKLLLPQPRGDAVARPRLTELLDQGRERRLTLVSAPAGFGKTMLLAKGLTQPTGQRRPIAWVSLEEDDSQPARFWTYLVTAIQRALPEVGDGALALLATGQPSLDGVVATLINELATTATELDLVLDDYHLVDNPDLQPSVTYLLEHLPPHVHMLISTRVDPALPLARLRARGDLVEIRAADLRFTLAEVATYFNEVAALELTTSDIAALETRTEGWVAALQLAALSLRGRSEPAAFIAAFAGDDRYIVDYLVEEVLEPPTAARARLPAPDLHPGPAERTAVRRRHREHREPGDAGAPGPRQPVPGPARRHPPLVPLPPPVRRGAADPPARGTRRGRGRPAPPRQPVVRRGGRTCRRRRPCPGLRRHRTGSRPRRARRPCAAAGPTRGDDLPLARSSSRTTWCRPGPCSRSVSSRR